MRILVQNYLQSKGIDEDFNIQFLRYTTKLYKNNKNKYVLEFPKWNFYCDKPQFTHEEIESALRLELLESMTCLINCRYKNDVQVAEDKIIELNNLKTIEEIKEYGV